MSAEKVLEAIATIDEWITHRPHEWFKFMGNTGGKVRWTDITRALNALKQDALLAVYDKQKLDDAAIEAARQWHLYMFAGVTCTSEDIRAMSRELILSSMAVQGMMYHQQQKRWFDPKEERLLEEVKKQHGPNWATVWFDSPDSL